MRFKKLRSTDIVKIIGAYQGCSGDADKKLSEEFNVSERTIRNWAYSLGLTRKAKEDNSNTTIEKVQENNHHAKVLVFDIETAPLAGYLWSIWKFSLGFNMDMLESDWFMLTWSAKWLFDEKVMADKLTPKEALEQNDKRIVTSLWALIEEADIIIAHNAVKFDEKKMNTRFLLHGLPKPMPYRVIDTLQHAKKRLAVTSNRLDYLGKFFGLGGKIDTGGWELWDRCVKGDGEALEKMELYNIRDIKLLEDVYLKMRPYIQPHPNMGLFITEDEEACPTCGETEDLERGGLYTTSVNTYEAIRCKRCGSIGRVRKGNFSIKNNSNLIAPVAR